MGMKQHGIVGALLCAATLISGCGDTSTDSSVIKTKGVVPHMAVRSGEVSRADGLTITTTKVEVSLKLASSANSDVLLSGLDTLKATTGGITQILTRQTGLFGDISYTTTFGFPVSAADVIVSLDRPGDISCPNSKVTIPDAFTVASPLPGQVFAGAATIPVLWDKASAVSGVMLLTFNTTCTAIDGAPVTASQAFSFSDTGSATIAAANILPAQSYDRTKACNSDLTLSRVAFGTLDPNYGAGGSFTGEQLRKLAIVLTQ